MVGLEALSSAPARLGLIPNWDKAAHSACMYSIYKVGENKLREGEREREREREKSFFMQSWLGRILSSQQEIFFET